MTSSAETAAPVHLHDMRVVEMVFDEGVAVRLYECSCGQTDVDAAA